MGQSLSVRKAYPTCVVKEKDTKRKRNAERLQWRKKIRRFIQGWTEFGTLNTNWYSESVLILSLIIS